MGSRFIFAAANIFCYQISTGKIIRMAKNFFLRWLQDYGARQRLLGINLCNDWAGQAAAELSPDSLL
jgi:hypothetical protein